MRTPRCVMVEWLDSLSNPQLWEFIDEMDDMEPPRCRSVGFVLADTAECMTLAPSMNDYQVLGRIVIPRGAIVSVKTLR